MTDSQRTPSPLDEICNRYVEDLASLDPLSATWMGLSGHDHEMPDLSPEGIAAQRELNAATLAKAASITPVDDVDITTADALAERLGLEIEQIDAGEAHREINNIASPVQALRDWADLAPTATAGDWENIAARLRAMPAAVAGYIESLRYAAARGQVAATRQIEAAAKQSAEQAGGESFFLDFTTKTAANALGTELSSGLAADLAAGAHAAQNAYATLHEFLTTELAPQAEPIDGVGRERYELASRSFLGSAIDLDETYEWGQEELARIISQQKEIAAELYGPGTSIAEAFSRLNEDPARQLHGTAALQEWMQSTSDSAIAALAGTHFEIAAPLHNLECKIAPTTSGGIYYTSPSADFSRPGRMWWSVPKGEDTFSTWQEKTTVYHEGIPGHHLQLGQAIYRQDRLNKWRSLSCWVSGHGEGWALYAEELMAELGFMDDPGDRMGMLDAQHLRAARVVLDIGVHLGKPRLDGTGTWDRDYAWEFLKEHVAMSDGFLSFELERYLGWPGQAPSYKVGQRLWQQARADYLASAASRAEEPTLRAFHAKALDLGSVGLDTLGRALRR